MENEENMTNEDTEEEEKNLQEIKQRSNHLNNFAISYCKALKQRKSSLISVLEKQQNKILQF